MASSHSEKPSVSAVIRGPEDSDLSAWRDLWDQYLTFYETTTSEGHAEALWRRLLDLDDPVECLIAEVDRQVVGMAQFFPHADTWSEDPICYLQDLFVDPQWRGRGIGGLLIRSIANRARQQGWSAVYWQTASDNSQARGLYDDLTGGPTGFIVYELEPPA